MNIHELLNKVKINIINDHPFYGTVIMNLSFIVCDTKEVCGEKVRGATDCFSTVYIDKDLNTNAEELIFVILHEVHHVICMHSQRQKERDHKLWNCACDYTVNLMIKEAGYKVPPNSLYDESYKGLTAEEIYEKLKTKKTLNTDETCFDILLPSKNPEIEKERVKDIIVQAYINHQKYQHRARGYLPGGITTIIKSIIEPPVAFEILLPRYASQIIAGKEEYTFNPIKKRYALEYGIVLPSISKKEVPRVIVAIDTSASISNNELKIFAGGIKKISAITPEITIITHDATVHQVIRTNEIESFLKNMRFVGRGGTSHVPVFRWIEKNKAYPDVLICLTDGETEIPDKKPRYPVIWALTEDGKEQPWGINIKLYPNQSL
jgi:predicted metal-dependent peptidase